MQVAKHKPVDAVHVYGAHDGLPGAPKPLAEQVPTLPTMLQASHAPPHAVLQHTPSMQLPLRHDAPTVQLAPFARLPTHMPPVQYALGTQSAATMQPAGHAGEDPLHT